MHHNIYFSVTISATGSLVIESLLEEDSGVYECMAQNIIGTAISNAGYLTVRSMCYLNCLHNQWNLFWNQAAKLHLVFFTYQQEKAVEKRLYCWESNLSGIFSSLSQYNLV